MGYAGQGRAGARQSWQTVQGILHPSARMSTHADRPSNIIGPRDPEPEWRWRWGLPGTNYSFARGKRVMINFGGINQQRKAVSGVWFDSVLPLSIGGRLCGTTTGTTGGSLAGVGTV